MAAVTKRLADRSANSNPEQETGLGPFFMFRQLVALGAMAQAFDQISAAIVQRVTGKPGCGLMLPKKQQFPETHEPSDAKQDRWVVRRCATPLEGSSDKHGDP
jgi:hypothetical protein